jgi:hypothetical protein
MTKPVKIQVTRPWKSDQPLGLDENALGTVMESLDKGDLDLFQKLNPVEREFVLRMVESLDKGDKSVLEALYAHDYDRIPVEPDVFFSATDYMGHIGRDIYKAWWGHLLKCADPTNGIYEVILTGPIGNGKTFVAMLLMVYKIYRLSCLKDPARHFGLAKKSQIVFGVYSLTLQHAEDVGFYKLRDQFIDESPYFREVFPRRPVGTDTIEWPQKSLKVMTGSSSLHAIGKDLFAITIDEINFMAKGKATAKKAHDLANATSRRLESRFSSGMGARDVPGICVFISSKKAETDYLDQRIKKVKGLPGVHIVDGPAWEFLAGDKINYCGRVFRVLLGDATHDPQILDDVTMDQSGVNVQPNLSQYEEARLEGKVIDVPVEHYKAFREDIIGAIRDVAGISTSATFNFFPRKKIVTDMFQSSEVLPKFFRSETITMPIRSPVKLTELFDLDLACSVSMSRRTPYRHPFAPRYAHVDLARNKDAVGIVVLHPSEFIVQKGDDVQGTHEMSVEKTLEVDLVLRITTDDSGEDIDFNKIEEFLIWMKRNGFWMRRVTYDSWQSAGSIQALKTFGIDAGVRSVDKSVLPYRILSRVMSDRKITCPNHEHLKQELGELLYIAGADKVDHPEGGSKDCADALAAAAYECTIDKMTPTDTPLQATPSTSSDYDAYLIDVEQAKKEMEEQPVRVDNPERRNRVRSV